jgi:hypothetical protein
LKNQLWRIARSSTVVSFEANMVTMKLLNPDSHAWLDELDPKTLVRAFQSELPKCEVLLKGREKGGEESKVEKGCRFCRKLTPLLAPSNLPN